LIVADTPAGWLLNKVVIVGTTRLSEVGVTAMLTEADCALSVTEVALIIAVQAAVNGGPAV
jgi:hypothetical protein